MATNKSLQLLRNSAVYTGPSLEGLKANMISATTQDGVAVLGRYNASGETKTLLGISHKFEGSALGMTFFENADQISSDIQELQDQIDALETEVNTIETAVGLNADGEYVPTTGANYTDSATSVVGAIDALDEAIKANADKIAGMDAGSVSGESKVVIDVTEADGVVTATAANLTGVKLDGYTEGTDADIAATDTLGVALGKLQAQINAMDKDADAVAGQVVTTVAEADGKVTETKANVKDLQLGGYTKDTAASGDIASTDTINVALSKLENKAAAITIANADGSINVTTGASGTDINVNIKSGEHVLAKDGNAGLYTDIKLSSVTPSSTAVKEEYSLIATDGSVLGTNIKIYKDSHIVSITYITDPADAHYQNLEYSYIDASGATKTEYVDISSLVLEAEFASGVTVTDHVAHGVVDPTSEAFLTVGADGFKLSGVQDAINTAISGLDATVGSQTIATGKHVAVEVVEADGKLTGLTVVEDDIASAAALAGLSGKTVTGIDMTGGTAAITDNTDGTKKITINADGSTLSASTGYVKAQTASAVAAGDSMDVALGKLEKQIDDAKAAATTKVVEGTDAGNNMEIVPTTGDDESVTYTINLTDVASDSALTAEIAARKAVDGQTGQTYAANASANYISSASNLNDADVKLDTALKAVSDKLNGTTIQSNNASITVAKTTGATGDTFDLQTDASKIDLTADLTGSSTSDATISAGTSLQDAMNILYGIAKHHHVTSGNEAISANTTASGTEVSLVIDEQSSLDTYNGNINDDLPNALTITNKGLFLSKVWDCGTF